LRGCFSFAEEGVSKSRPESFPVWRISGIGRERRGAMTKRGVKVMLVLAMVAVAISMTIEGAEARLKAMCGKAKLAYTKENVVPIGDAGGHVLTLGDASGLDTNTGTWEVIDGAKSRSFGTQDLTKGNGPQTRDFTLSREGVETVAGVSGTVRTVLFLAPKTGDVVMKKLAVAAIGILVLACWSSLLLAADTTVKIMSKGDLGSYLTNKVGWTLYWSTKDSPGKSVCEGQCLEKWPTFYRASMTVPPQLKAKDFGTLTRPDGAKQTTFRGYPLYYWANDTGAGDTKGQGVNGVWFVIDPQKFPPKAAQ
jgi:predicted lipoprotein with Yx(FWY)xxD motif